MVTGNPGMMIRKKIVLKLIFISGSDIALLELYPESYSEVDGAVMPACLPAPGKRKNEDDYDQGIQLSHICYERLLLRVLGGWLREAETAALRDRWRRSREVRYLWPSSSLH